MLDSLALQEAFQPVVFSLAAGKFAHEALDAYLALIRLSVEAEVSPNLSLGKIVAKIETLSSFLNRFSFHRYCGFLGSICLERIESLYYRTMHQSGVVLIDVIWLREDIIILQHASFLSLADF